MTRERVSLLGWPEHRLHHVESFVGMHVGGGDDARDRALAFYPQATWRGPAQVKLHRAAALVHAGDVTEGTRYASAALAPLNDAQRADRFIRPLACKLHAA